jgi:hemolysin III
MDFLQLREPFSALSHGAGLLLSVPATVYLLRRSTIERSKRTSLFIYGLSLAACYGASSLFHGIRATGERLAPFQILDHVAIYVLIAGTYTPIAATLLRGRWRRGTLRLVWLAAVIGGGLHVACGTLPVWLSTALYLGIGWGAIFCYYELRRTFSHRALRPILVGGMLYSVGAMINLFRWPSLVPGIVDFHGVFHLFVLAGSAAHFWFMHAVVTPTAVMYEEPAPELPNIALPASGPHWRFRRRNLVPLIAETTENPARTPG